MQLIQNKLNSKETSRLFYLDGINLMVALTNSFKIYELIEFVDSINFQKYLILDKYT